MYYCIVDCETTGLDPVRHALISVAFILKPNLKDDYCLLKKEFRMNPGSYEIDPRALKVNGYTEEEIRSWPDRARTTENIRCTFESFGMNEKAIPVGHNYLFDRSFLLQILPAHFYEAYFDYHYLDTMIVSNFLNLARPGFSDGVSLRNLRDKYGLTNNGAHTALKDAEDTCEVAMRLINELR